MSRQAERSLQTEIMIRLKALPVLAIPVPNGIWLPARTAAERTLVARIISQIKKTGLLLPGAPDLVILSRSGAGLIELKRPAERTLLKKIPKGQLTAPQKDFRDLCRIRGVNWAECSSWDEVRAALTEWGVLA